MTQATDHRRATAERNVQAILDAAEDLLARQAPVSIAAVATQAGVSRVTVYSHFPTWEALLEAVVERAVGHVSSVMAEADLPAGPPPEALRRLLAIGWRELARSSEMAEAAAQRLSAEAMARSHHAAYGLVTGLVERGREDGSFRTDVPVSWLVASCFALIHACAGEVRSGRMDAGDALRILTVTVTDLFAARLRYGHDDHDRADRSGARRAHRDLRRPLGTGHLDDRPGRDRRLAGRGHQAVHHGVQPGRPGTRAGLDGRAHAGVLLTPAESRSLAAVQAELTRLVRYDDESIVHEVWIRQRYDLGAVSSFAPARTVAVRTAWHEAGHAVAALAVGARFSSASIRYGCASQGRVNGVTGAGGEAFVIDAAGQIAERLRDWTLLASDAELRTWLAAWRADGGDARRFRRGIRARFGDDELAAWRYCEQALIPLRLRIRSVARALLVHPRHLPYRVVAAIADGA